uniref:Protein naked cuticle homolog n=1 Tax=Panthera tigris altaica TaxID=74533 RepID=A0A8C9JPG6_PANTA
ASQLSPGPRCLCRAHSPCDSFAVSAAWARKGIEEWIGRQRCPGGSSGPRQLRAAGTVGRGTRELVGEIFRETLSEEEEEGFRLEVALPPEKTDGLASGDEKRREKASESCPGPKKQLKFEELQCDVSVEEDSRQEWTFTLYDFDNNGKVTREDITSLLHTIYEVVDSSVNHSPTSSKTLRVKLTVAPDGSQGKKGILLNHPDLQSTRPRAETKPAEELRSWEKKQRALLRFQGDSRLEQSGCDHHCVDENIERRNHYLDLAGIENYTSQFGPGKGAPTPAGWGGGGAFIMPLGWGASWGLQCNEHSSSVPLPQALCPVRLATYCSVFLSR